MKATIINVLLVCSVIVLVGGCSTKYSFETFKGKVENGYSGAPLQNIDVELILEAEKGDFRFYAESRAKFRLYYFKTNTNELGEFLIPSWEGSIPYFSEIREDYPKLIFSFIDGSKVRYYNVQYISLTGPYSYHPAGDIKIKYSHSLCEYEDRIIRELPSEYKLRVCFYPKLN